MWRGCGKVSLTLEHFENAHYHLRPMIVMAQQVSSTTHLIYSYITGSSHQCMAMAQNVSSAAAPPIGIYGSCFHHTFFTPYTDFQNNVSMIYT